jgi:hypothetical protein
MLKQFSDRTHAFSGAERKLVSGNLGNFIDQAGANFTPTADDWVN